MIYNNPQSSLNGEKYINLNRKTDRRKKDKYKTVTRISSRKMNGCHATLISLKKYSEAPIK